MQLEIRTLLSGPVFDDDCKKQIRGDLERFYAPRCKQPNFLSKDFLRLGIPPIDWKSKVGSFQRGLTLKRRALFYRAAYYMPIFEGEMKKTFALRPNPPGACGAWGVWRNAKVFLPQKVFYEKTKKKRKKNPEKIRFWTILESQRNKFRHFPIHYTCLFYFRHHTKT